MENLELVELKQEELQEIEGGVPWIIPIIIGAAVVEIIGDWENFKAGLSGNAPVSK